MARAVGFGGLHHLAGIGVDNDRRRRRLIGGSGGTDSRTMSAAAGIGVAGESGDGKQQRHTGGATAET